MGEWLRDQLNSFGIRTKSVDLGTQVVDGKELPFPPVIVGRLGDNPDKKTVLVYGHYDVQPAEKSDGWNTDPFTLYEDPNTGRLYGRGATDDKGPIMGWLNVMEAHTSLGLELPVNLRFCFEGMEECGSPALGEFITAEAAKGKESWFDGVDCVCVCDNFWLNDRTPCLTYGLRGTSYFSVHVSGPTQDLHSGVFGRMVYDPMSDLISLMDKLVAPDGKILVPGLEDMVPPPTEEERAMYNSIDYTIQDVEELAGAPITLSMDKAEVLMGRMRYPSLSLHGIEGAFSGPGAKTVIPASVTGKFSIRMVPPQTPEIIEPMVISYLTAEFEKRRTKNKLRIDTVPGAKPWAADHDHWNYRAAKRATELIWHKTPDYTREGGSLPPVIPLTESLGANILLLPMGRGDDAAHSTNEKMDRSNFLEGSKLLGTYLYEVAAISTDADEPVKANLPTAASTGRSCVIM